MTKISAIKLWIKAFYRALGSIVSFIAYFRLRDWFIPIINDKWYVGYFEGIATMIILYSLVERYGDAAYEIYLGLRELGSLRKEKESNVSNNA